MASRPWVQNMTTGFTQGAQQLLAFETDLQSNEGHSRITGSERDVLRVEQEALQAERNSLTTEKQSGAGMQTLVDKLETGAHGHLYRAQAVEARLKDALRSELESAFECVKVDREALRDELKTVWTASKEEEDEMARSVCSFDSSCATGIY